MAGRTRRSRTPSEYKSKRISKREFTKRIARKCGISVSRAAYLLESVELALMEIMTLERHVQLLIGIVGGKRHPVPVDGWVRVGNPFILFNRLATGRKYAVERYKKFQKQREFRKSIQYGQFHY